MPRTSKSRTSSSLKRRNLSSSSHFNNSQGYKAGKVTASSTSQSFPETSYQPIHIPSSEDILDEDQIDNIIVMAIDVKERGNIGCAYYKSDNAELCCMQESPFAGTELVERLRFDIQPTTVLISHRVKDNSSGLSINQWNPIDDDSNFQSLLYEVLVRPTSDFKYENGLNKLLSLDLSSNSFLETKLFIPGEQYGDKGNTDHNDLGMSIRQGKLFQVSSCIDLENRLSIGCAGAVLSYLLRKRTSEYLPDDPAVHQAYQISHLGMFSLSDTMFISAETFQALQIILPEFHPNAFNQGSSNKGSKQSLSLFGLFQLHAKSPQGKAKLRQIFLRPSITSEQIQERLDFISVFVRPDNLQACEKLMKSLSKIKTMRKCIILLHKGIDCGSSRVGGYKIGVWSSLLDFCYHAIDIGDSLREVIGAHHLPLYQRVVQTLDRTRLLRIGKIVNDAVDLELSQAEFRTIIKRGIDDQLDHMKDMYNGMDELLSRTANEIAATLPTDVNVQVIYFPQLGFHITIPRKNNCVMAFESGIIGWQKSFTTQNQVYYKNDRMHRMDNELGDLYGMICDSEIEIAHELALTVLKEEDLLIAASDVCGDLDSNIALTWTANELRLTKPAIVEENVIDIKGGRHLLHEMTVPSYVPNDTYLVGGEPTDGESNQLNGPNMILLTGPNYSGKSAYQKQVALVVYLAQIGSFVPAERAVIGMTDKILTRITTQESVSRNQSAFMIDLQQIAIAFNSCTSRSLVIIDEFGKGTDTCDGAGLAAGVFQHFISANHHTPKVLAATHFHEIFQEKLLDVKPNVTFAHMEVLLAKEQYNERQKSKTNITYLYNLCEGLSNNSYGTQCAALNGIPEPIILRASQIGWLALQGEDLVAACSTPTTQEEEELNEAEVVARSFLELDFVGLQKPVFEILDDILGRCASK